jgi:phosphopentomutase
MKEAIPLGDRETFADLGATVAAFFGVEGSGIGRSFLTELGPIGGA